MSEKLDDPTYFRYHIAFVLRGTIGYMYINDVEETIDVLTDILNVKRNHNYIGKGVYDGRKYFASAIYDDIKIYKIALSQTQVISLYKQKNSDFLQSMLINIY